MLTKIEKEEFLHELNKKFKNNLISLDKDQKVIIDGIKTKISFKHFDSNIQDTRAFHSLNAEKESKSNFEECIKMYINSENIIPEYAGRKLK